MPRSFPSRHRTGNSTRRRTTRPKSAVISLMLLILLFTIAIGTGLAQAFEPRSLRETAALSVPSSTTTIAAQPSQSSNPSQPSDEIGTVDVVPERFQLGQQLYLEHCASCHLGIPPAVMPTQTWQTLLQDPQHYGVTIDLPTNLDRTLIWNYLRTYSRPTAKDEAVPYRLRESRYLKALHPKLDLPRNIGVGTCISCHPSAQQFNFRKLTPAAANTP